MRKNKIKIRAILLVALSVILIECNTFSFAYSEGTDANITENSINATNTNNTLDSQNASNTLGVTVLLGLLCAGGYFGFKKLKEKEKNKRH